MEEIKVGDFIRTRSKGIKRVCRIDNNKTVNKYMCKGRNDLEYDEYEIVKTTEVIRHSPSITGVIENGDIVTLKMCDLEVIKPLDTVDIIALISKEIELVNVLTYEQFNSIKYVIGE